MGAGNAAGFTWGELMALYMVDFLRMFFLLLFGYALIGKLLSPARFADIIQGYRLLPNILVPIATYMVIGVEALGIILLVLQPVLAGVYVGTLLAFYTMAIGVNILRGKLDFDCGCVWSPSDKTNQTNLSNLTWLMTRNIVLIGVAFFLFTFDRLALAEYSWSFTALILPALAASFYFSLYLFLDALMGMFLRLNTTARYSFEGRYE